MQGTSPNFIRTDFSLKFDDIVFRFMSDNDSFVEILVRQWEPLTVTLSSNSFSADIMIQSIVWRVNGNDSSKYHHSLFKRHPSTHSSQKHMLRVHISTTDPLPNNPCLITVKADIHFALLLVPKPSDWQLLFCDFAPNIQDYFIGIPRLPTFKLLVCLHKCGVCYEGDSKIRGQQAKVEVERGKVHFAGVHQMLMSVEDLIMDYGNNVRRITMKTFLFEWLSNHCRVEVGETLIRLFPDDLPMLVAETAKFMEYFTVPPNKTPNPSSNVRNEPPALPRVDLCSFGFTEYEIHDLLHTRSLSVSGDPDSSIIDLLFTSLIWIRPDTPAYIR